MKGISSSENYSDYNINKNESVSPAAIEAGTGKNYSPEEYNNPELKNKTWCSFMERGFRASRNVTDKQSGNHTEASADVIEEETSMNKLQPEELQE